MDGVIAAGLRKRGAFAPVEKAVSGIAFLNRGAHPGFGVRAVPGVLLDHRHRIAGYLFYDGPVHTLIVADDIAHLGRIRLRKGSRINHRNRCGGHKSGYAASVDLAVKPFDEGRAAVGRVVIHTGIVGPVHRVHRHTVDGDGIHRPGVDGHEVVIAHIRPGLQRHQAGSRKRQYKSSTDNCCCMFHLHKNIPLWFF